MKTWLSAVLTKLVSRVFKRGISTSASPAKLAVHHKLRPIKPTHSDDPIPKDSRDTLSKWAEDSDGLPPGLPGSKDIRRLADVLAHQVPADSIHALIQAKDYTSCHELTGFHQAIEALRDLADNVDATNEEAAQAAQAASQ